MTKVQVIKSAGGEELAVLPKAEYERLVALAAEGEEDVGTRRLVRQARQNIAAGKEVIIPKEIVDRLAAGDNPVRVLRHWREMSQPELSVRIGITQGYLSDLEMGKKKGPFELHQKIARALNVPLDLLASIAVSLAEADSERVTRRRQVISETGRNSTRRR